MHYWFDVKPPKDVRPSDLAKQLDNVNTRLLDLKRFVTIVAVLGALVAASSWLLR